MLTGEIVAGFLIVFGLPFVSFFLRRKFLSRSGGAIELSLRLKPKSQGRGWVLGVGRFVGDDLQWFRVFSLSTRPRRTLSRRDLEVHSHRAPHGPEAFSLLKGAQVVSLTSSTGPVEIAMDDSAMTGFLAWLEARPPGATLPA